MIKRVASDTRQRLVETALELIWRESYGAVSVDEICARAGVQKGSFYHYFPSKADLVLASIDWGMENMKTRFDEIFSPTRLPAHRFERLVEDLCQKQEKIKTEQGRVCGCPFATLGSELAAQNEKIGNKIKGISAHSLIYYESALRDLIAAGQIDPKTDIKSKAEQIYALILGYMTMARIRNDLDCVRSNLKKAIFDLIGIREQSPMKILRIAHN